MLNDRRYPTSNESSAKKPTMNHAPVRGERVCVSVCVLGEPWLELLADRVLLRCVNETFLFGLKLF